MIWLWDLKPTPMASVGQFIMFTFLRLLVHVGLFGNETAQKFPQSADLMLTPRWVVFAELDCAPTEWRGSFLHVFGWQWLQQEAESLTAMQQVMV